MTWKQITRSNSHPIWEEAISASTVAFPPEPAGQRAPPQHYPKITRAIKRGKQGLPYGKKAEQHGMQLLFYFIFRYTVFEIKY